MGSTPLEPTPDEMRQLLSAAAARVIAFVESLPRQPASSDPGEAVEMARALAEPQPPEHGAPFEELLATVFDRAAPMGFNAAGPGYLAYIPGGGLFAAALADLMAAALNRFTGLWEPAPALVQLESDALRWLCALVGYPAGSGGILTSGGSMANLSALFTARREVLGDDFSRGAIYASDQVHHSLMKAARVAGFAEHQVREVPSDAAFRLDLDALRADIARDRAAGLRPFLLVANGGSTNTGAVDDLDGAADLAARERLWLHVDAAYGGFFVLTARGRAALRGLERADSVTLDPHKSLFLPYGTGALLVRELGALRRAHAMDAEYLPRIQQGSERLDFAELSPELSRPFRGLGVWLALKLHGVAAFRAALDEKLDLARLAAERLRALPGIEIVAEPQLSAVAFRLADEGRAPDECDARNRELLARINARRRVFLSGTRLRGRFVLRLCVLSVRTHRERLEQALEDIGGAAAELREERGEQG